MPDEKKEISMRVELNFGKHSCPVELSDDWNVTIIRKPTMPLESDGKMAVQRALNNPVGCPRVKDLAQGKKNVCILICDITRPVPNGTILPVLVKELMEAGIEAKHITVLVATGLHRPNEGKELEELVGDSWVLKTVEVINHFANRDADHVQVGVTDYGTKVRLDHRFVNADLRIVTGLVEPHLFAGYSGGRKVITPGIAHAETISTIHNAHFIEHPKSTNCVLEGNQLHAEQLEIVALLGSVYAVNTVIDENRQLSFVNFGEIVGSHLEAVDVMRRYAEVTVPAEFPTVVTSCAGYPLDKTYYQTVKGMVGALNILKNGGSLIIASECSEGLGSPEYIEAQTQLVALGPDEFLKQLKSKSIAAIDEWQAESLLKPMRRGKVELYAPGLSSEEAALTGVKVIESMDRAISESVERSKDPRVAVVPEGPYVVPFVEAATN